MKFYVSPLLGIHLLLLSFLLSPVAPEAKARATEAQPARIEPKRVEAASSTEMAFMARPMESGNHTPSPDYEEMVRQARMLMEARRFADAATLVLQAVEGQEVPVDEAVRAAYVEGMLIAVECQEEENRPEQAFDLCQRLLDGTLLDDAQRTKVEKHIVQNGYDWATTLMGDRRNPEAQQQARGILEQVLPLCDADDARVIRKNIAFAWYVEGHGYCMAQQVEQGLRCMREAYPLFCQVGYTMGEYLSLRNIGSLYAELCELQPAVEAYGKAWEVARRTNDGGRMMEVLTEVKPLYAMLGDVNAEAATMLSMDSLVYGMNDSVAIFQYNLDKGQEAMGQGEFELAELWYSKNAGFVEQTDSKNQPYALKHHVALRDLYLRMNRFDEALGHAGKCTAIERAILGEGRSSEGLSIISTAEIYKRMGYKERCMACFDTLFLKMERMEEPRERYQLYSSRGMAHIAFKDYEKALQDYRTADDLLATKYDEADPCRVTLLALMGRACHEMGRNAEAEQLFVRYARMCSEVYGEYSQKHIEALRYMAKAEALAGHVGEGCSHLALAAEKMRERVKERLPHRAGQERDAAWQRILSLMMELTPFAIKAGEMQTPFTRSCYDALVLSKAFLLESDRSAFDIISRKGDAQALEEYMNIASLEMRLEKLERNYRQNADSITTLTALIAHKSRRLAARCREWGDITEFMDIGYNEVQEALGKKDVLIDFTYYTTETDGRKYAAYIVKHGQANPLLMPLFAESRVDSLGIRMPQDYYEGAAAAALREMLWKPLSSHVRRGATVYYVPSHLLFHIALESIPLPDGTLLGEHYHFVRLSSARELTRYQPSLRLPATTSRAVLYGGLQYDVPADIMLAERQRMTASIPPIFACRAGDVRHGESAFADLPGTRQELTEVETVLKKKGISVVPYTGTDGTAESFVSLSGNAPQMLLMATHGFYYTPQEAERYDFLKGYKDAMSLSGIVLAGGNAAWLGKPLPKGVMGGILTANDIAKLDLDGLEMVVLSACQSGAGMATCEGVYGLQRGFKKAGAKTIVMTLWGVNDVVTREFIVKFHQCLATPKNAWNKRAAFEQAKAYIRKRYPEPYCWAPFIMLD